MYEVFCTTQDNMDEAISYALQKLSYPSIRDYQKKVVEGYVAGKDVFFCAPTGSGKSLVFEIAPFVFQKVKNIEKCTVIVVSPLSSLMKSQTDGLQKRSIKALYLKDVSIKSSDFEENFMSLSLNEVKHGEVSIIFGSPESILDHSRNILLELSKKHLIKAVFVDEAHCIKK